MPIITRTRTNKKISVPVINSVNIKAALLFYFRFKRQGIFLTECNIEGPIADIYGYLSSFSYEIEVKISISDLRNEIKKDRYKWNCENEASYYYFCVPIEILDKAQKFINSNFPNAGIIAWDRRRSNFYGAIHIYQRGIKRNKKKRIDNNFPLFFLKRMSSEIQDKLQKMCKYEEI